MAEGNWGRWGTEDQRGALNLVDEAARRRGLEAATRAVPISLGLPVGTGVAPHAALRPEPQHFMVRDGGDYAAGLPERPGLGWADDVVILPCHGTTHLDALAHVWRDGLMWNGFPANEVTSRGARVSGVETVGPIVTRGVLVDLPRVDDSPIGAREVEEALGRVSVVPEPGDALLVRTGWLARWRDGTASKSAWPGIDTSVVDLVDRWGLSLVGADNISVEVTPSGDPQCALPVHVALLRDRGVFLLELLDLELLSAAAATTFLLVVSPLNIVGGSGSPVAPTAVI
jgi:kynurenine formamidase